MYVLGMPQQRSDSSHSSWAASPSALIWVGIGVVLFSAVGAVAVFAPKLGRMLHLEPNPEKLDKQRNYLLSQTGALLNLELGKVLTIIRSRIGTDESYAASLTAAQARLAELTNSEQVRVIVSLLVAENHRMRIDSANMAKQLDASRLQIEALRTRLEKAYEVGLQDPLTSVGNRRCFDLALSQAVSSATSAQAPLSIVMGDLDHFKKINDDFGHQIGDEVLKFFTQLMVGSVRDGDTVARFGGEEFAIILPQCALREANAIAERIRNKLSAKALTMRRTSTEIGIVTASFGIAQLEHGENVDALLSRADRNLYDAKRAGRNRVAGF